MHRHDALLRQQIVECGKNRFFDFARIFGAADQDDPLFQIENHEGLGGGAVGLGVGQKTGGHDHMKIGLDFLCGGLGMAQKELGGKKVVPREFGDDP